ncbi:uncharacterized protein F5147DRAFT_382645 [Suillus discolor]|uniref:Uncharacterized protein n=1 Tax=Suillus discolor TaxID=1912936 RepID=A0A9P7JXT7_9AGAM|nr:uncharacterized protein F5147DRAFT_382645 [Suillus discolor]KAG2115854.1 hypothetical protein F5147DRAFT_382645 [Suillus discolor]
MKQTSSMGPGPGYPHPQQQGMPGGPRQMPDGNMMRPGPMQGAPMNNFQPHGVPPNMGNPGNAMSPGMVPGPGHNMMNLANANAALEDMTAKMKNLLVAAAPGVSEQGFHPVQGQQQFVGPQNNRIGQNLAQAKPMGGMSPPASPGHPNLSDLPPNFMSSDFMQSMSALVDLDPSMFRADFEQDFREWFDPTPSVPPASNPTSQPQSNLSSDSMQSISALEDLDPSMFRTHFEQDFREWFDPGCVERLK